MERLCQFIDTVKQCVLVNVELVGGGHGVAHHVQIGGQRFQVLRTVPQVMRLQSRDVRVDQLPGILILPVGHQQLQHGAI